MQPSLSAPPGSRPHGIGDPALSRRALRRREEQERSLVRHRTRRSPRLPPAPVRRAPVARAARPLFTALTMLAAAAMAFVTSVPANALLDHDDLVSVRLAQYATGEAQELDATTAEAAAIVRDGYAVRTAAENLMAKRFGGVESFVNNRQSDVQWPFAVAVPVTDGFGYRNSPCSGCSSMHQGTDFTPGYGAPVQAIADGVVRSVVSSDSGLGVHVVIEHLIGGDLITSTYAHMQFGSVPLWEGQAIGVGDLVGLVGNTGASTGPHLHFELRLGGTKAVDAYAWLQRHAG
jgi:murein DD-endopeptidase MepM/ murein hydrolase activator NlpD